MPISPPIVSGSPAATATPAVKPSLGEWLVATTYFIVSAQVAAWIIFVSFACTRIQESYFSRFDLHGRFHQLGEAFAEGISLGTLPGPMEEIHQEQAQAAAIRTATALVSHLSWFLFGITALFLIFSVVVHRDSIKQFSSRSVRYLLGVSAIFLIVGLLAPVLTMSVAPMVPVLGKVFLAFKSKTIVSAIAAMFSSGNWFAAVLVLLFSVLTPAAKLISAKVAVGAHPERRIAIKKVLDAIGKWSMADVFVVALLLACLALRGSDSSTAARPLWGFYFFTGYCLMSMIVSFALGRISPEVNTDARSGGKASTWRLDTVTRAVFVILVSCCACYGLIYYSLGKRAATYVAASVTHQPVELQNSIVRVRASSTLAIPLALPYSGNVAIEVQVLRGNPVNVFVLTPQQFSNLRSGRRAQAVNNSREVNSRNYARSVSLQEGLYYLGLRDTTLGLLSAPISEISVHANLSR
jgi:hypothetical protein